MKSLRSPLSNVLGAGSAKEGTGHFWSQRLSAVAIVLLGSWFLLALPGLEPTHGAVLAWLASPVTSILLLLLVAMLGWHSNLGVQVVIEDYVHGPFIKVTSLIACKFAHGLAVVAAGFSILKIAFGGVA